MAYGELRRGYCLQCLRDLKIDFELPQLSELEAFGIFPSRVAPLMWDAEEVDDWLERRDGERPVPPICH